MIESAPGEFQNALDSREVAMYDFSTVYFAIGILCAMSYASGFLHGMICMQRKIKKRLTLFYKRMGE